MNIKGRFLLPLLILSLLLPAILLGGCQSGGSGKLASIQSAKKLVVYTNAEFPPFEYISSDAVVGVDMDIAKAIADDLGVELEINDAPFDGIITSLASGRGDIAISGFTIREDRKEMVDFSKPYINSVQYLILPADSDIKTMEDLGGKRVGAALGYTGEFVLDDEIEEGALTGAGVQKITVNSAIDGALDILNDRLDAVVMDEFVALKIAADYDSLKAVKLVFEDGGDVAEEYGVAVPKGNQALVDRINKVIDTLNSDGKIAEWVIEHS